MHLIVLHHGLWGWSGHLDFIALSLEKKAKESNAKVKILNINESAKLLTHDGIDVCGDRAFTALMKVSDETKPTQISFVSFFGY